MFRPLGDSAAESPPLQKRSSSWSSPPAAPPALVLGAADSGGAWWYEPRRRSVEREGLWRAVALDPGMSMAGFRVARRFGGLVLVLGLNGRESKVNGREERNE